MSLVLSSCGVPVEKTARELPGIEQVVTSSTTSTMPAVPPEAIENVAVVVYLVTDQGLVARGRIKQGLITDRALISYLTEGAVLGETLAGIRSALAQREDFILGVATVDGVVKVDLGSNFNTIPGNEQVLILGQITLTLVANLDVWGVAFSQEGRPIAVPNAGGEPVTRVVTRADYSSLISPL